MIRFLVDANLPTGVSKVLGADGHEVRDVRHVSPPLPDAEVYALAKREGRVLLTRDLDFSNPLRYPPEGTVGIVVCRVGDMTASEIASLVRGFVRAQTPENLVGVLVILEPFRVRFRRSRSA